MKKICIVIAFFLAIMFCRIGPVKAEYAADAYHIISVNNSIYTQYYMVTIEAREDGYSLVAENIISDDPEGKTRYEYPCVINEIDRVTAKISGQKQIIMGHNADGENYGYIFDFKEKQLTEFRIYGDIPADTLIAYRDMDFFLHDDICYLIYMTETESMQEDRYEFEYELRVDGYPLYDDDRYLRCEIRLDTENYPNGMLRNEVYCGGIYGTVMVINIGEELYCLDLTTGEWVEANSVFTDEILHYLSGKAIDGIYQNGAYDIIVYREKRDYGKIERWQDRMKDALECEWESRILLINREDETVCRIELGSEYGNFVTDVVQSEDAVEIYVLDVYEITYYDSYAIDGPMLANRAFQKIRYGYDGHEIDREEIRIFYNTDILSIPK